MAVTTVASGNQVTQWTKKFISEYVRDSIFARFMGTSENDIIQIKKELQKQPGNIISIPLIGKLTNAGVTGDNTLEGNEESLNNYNHDITVDQVRNAVVVGRMANRSTAVDILEAARIALKLWVMDDMRDDILQAMQSPNVDGVTAYASATEAQKDAWVVANNISTTDSRILFGAVQSNSGLTDHSTDIANVDSTTDVLDFDIVQLAKRMARRARASGGTRNIRPVRTKGGREFFTFFIESFSFRDLKTDTETIHQNAGVRGKENPLFQDPDLLLDGVGCVEVPEIPVISGVGASSIDVSPGFFCGAQAVGLAWGQMTKFVIKRDLDYENQVGVSIGDIRGTEKVSHNDVQNGVLTVYTSGVADS
jgi:N4-gp56 family major capsid protein